MAAAPRDQFAALIRAFLARFFENEITRGTDDLKSSFFWMAGILAGPGIYIPGTMSFQWSVVALTQGSEVLQIATRGDKAFYLGLAVVASAIVSTIAWDSLLPDRRDALILGALPVRPSTVIASKLLALGAYIGLVAIAMHTIAAVFFGFGLAARGTFTFLLTGIVAHLVASFAASAFVLLAVTGLQGIVLAAVGAQRFSRVSPVLQAALVALIVSGLLALPVINGSTVHTLAGTGSDVRPWILLTPPLWFLGIYEWVLGTNDVVLLNLARTGTLATIAALAATLVAYPLAYRRVMVSVAQTGSSRSRTGPGALIAERLVAATGRFQGTHAVAQFYLATITRGDRHRFLLAISLGFAAAWGLPGWLSLVTAPPKNPRLDLLSMPLATMAFLLAGLRVAASLPGDIKAGWLFDVTASSRLDARRALERLMSFIVVVPVVLVFAPIYWWLWGAWVAVSHSGLALSMGMLLIQVLLWRFDGSVCARPWNVERIGLERLWPVYVGGFLVFTAVVPSVELMLFDMPLAGVSFVAATAVTCILVRYASLKQQVEAEVERDAAPGEILGLN